MSRSLFLSHHEPRHPAVLWLLELHGIDYSFLFPSTKHSQETPSSLVRSRHLSQSPSMLEAGPGRVGRRGGYSHSVCPVAAVIHGGGHGHDQRRDAVAHQIEVAPAGMLALKHLHQHDVELHALQEHPGESSQEEEVQEGGEDGTGDLPGRERAVVFKWKCSLLSSNSGGNREML